MSGVECIEIAEHFSFSVGNAIKYLWRAESKGAPLDDLRKARWYIDREIARREQVQACQPARSEVAAVFSPFADWIRSGSK